jgi:hypothetical protein
MIATDLSQMAPEPVRVRLSRDDTGLGQAVWVKVPLLVTVERSTLIRPVASLGDPALRRVLNALHRVLDLGTAFEANTP